MRRDPGILVIFHCESNPGYAAASHELSFLEMARRLVGHDANIHFAYPDLSRGMSPGFPGTFRNVIQFDAASRDRTHLRRIARYIRANNIRLAFGFDQPVRRDSYRFLRRAGLRYLISYWGAPLGSFTGPLRRCAKRLEVLAAPYRPDHFIFQSEGMRETAVQGRGIPRSRTSVVRTGIDIARFAPAPSPDYYAHEVFGIPRQRHIIFFSGHVDGRKGIDSCLQTAVELAGPRAHSDFHLLIAGNRDGADRWRRLCRGTAAEKHITFGGYRHDVPRLLRSCSIGFIASTGWDSFPMSSIETAAAGLPLVVSDLPGLREAVTEHTGIRYPAGDSGAAADCLERLLDRPDLRAALGREGRVRAIREFSRERQIAAMEAIVRRVARGLRLLPDSDLVRLSGSV